MYTRQCISSNNGESAQASVTVAMAVGVAGVHIVMEAACSFVCVGLVVIFLTFLCLCWYCTCFSAERLPDLFLATSADL
jgi:hypothetical protein